MVFPPPLGNGYTLCSKKVFVYRSHSHRFFYSLSATQARPGSTKRTAFLRYINPISLLSVFLQRHLFTLEAVNIPSFHHPLHSDAVLFQLRYHPLNNNSTLPPQIDVIFFSPSSFSQFGLARKAVRGMSSFPTYPIRTGFNFVPTASFSPEVFSFHI